MIPTPPSMNITLAKGALQEINKNCFEIQQNKVETFNFNHSITQWLIFSITIYDTYLLSITYINLILYYNFVLPPLKEILNSDGR